MSVLTAMMAGAGSILPASVHAASEIHSDHVRISWIAPERFGTGEEHVGIRFELEPGWHIYWKNPGDSGAAPKFDFASKGAALGPILWPFPKRIPFGDLTNLGYEGNVVLPVSVRPKGSAIRVEAELEWLVCEEECIPGFGRLDLARPAGENESTWKERDRERIRTALARVPMDSSESTTDRDASPWSLSASAVGATDDGHVVRLMLSPSAANLRDSRSGPPEVFPVDGEQVLPGAPLVKETSGGGYVMTFPLIPGRKPPESTGFVMVASDGRAWEYAAVPITRTRPTDGTGTPLWLLLLSSVLGGMILNLMPCVFPVLSIKVFSLVGKGGDRSAHFRSALRYAAGVLAAFGALGMTFLVLREAGGVVGWGFQLQSPAVVLGLAALFWLMALNFMGVFDFGGSLMRWAGGVSLPGGRGRPGVESSGAFSDFFTGVLSVFVAAPCTGPFMGTALGASATLPAMQSMLIFLGLGVGLALPFVFLASAPGMLSRLPRPGPWMETFKQFLAFPLFATVLWLLWVLGRQVGDAGWLAGGGLLLSTGFALWTGRSRRKLVRAAAWTLGVAAFVVSIRMVAGAETQATGAGTASWEVFSPSAVEAARSEGDAVFVDFTAAWCITCQWNKKAVLEAAPTVKLFSDHHVRLFRADWTNQDPVITKALAAFGRNSVPVYVFYPAGRGRPRVLPQILSNSIIQELFLSSQSKEEETP